MGLDSLLDPRYVSPTYNPVDYERPSVTADVALLAYREQDLQVLLIRRKKWPYQDFWALPGGFVETEENLADAASRELVEETGLEVSPGALRQLGAYGAPGRDPRMRTVSIVYWIRIPDPGEPVGGSDAAASSWMPVDEALSHDFSLAFDHRLILDDARKAARG